ncbi:MAG: hypothetical protein WBC44_04385 [Planctomycetaceae bacterium]
MREATPTTDRTAPDTAADRFVERIEQFVRLRTGGMIHGLHVEVGSDRVVLTGRTSTFYSKQLATHAALDVLDDQTLSNLIEVN